MIACEHHARIILPRVSPPAIWVELDLRSIIGQDSYSTAGLLVNHWLATWLASRCGRPG